MPDRPARTRHAPRRARWPGVLGLLVAVVTLLPACTASGTTDTADESVARTTSAEAAPDAAATDPVATDPPDDTAAGCDDDIAALDAVITEQLAAFTTGDWDRAYALTSRQFRASGVDADGLREIVTSGYAEAADARRHEVIGCVRTGREAQVLIEITATDGATLGLVYLMTREDGRWRISGAVEHGTGGSEPATIPA